MDDSNSHNSPEMALGPRTLQGDNGIGVRESIGAGRQHRPRCPTHKAPAAAKAAERLQRAMAVSSREMAASSQGGLESAMSADRE